MIFAEARQPMVGHSKGAKTQCGAGAPDAGPGQVAAVTRRGEALEGRDNVKEVYASGTFSGTA